MVQAKVTWNGVAVDAGRAFQIRDAAITTDDWQGAPERVGIECTARVAMCGVGTGSDDKSPACDLQNIKFDIVLEEIGWKDGNFVVVEIPTRAAGCEV